MICGEVDIHLGVRRPIKLVHKFDFTHSSEYTIVSKSTIISQS